MSALRAAEPYRSPSRDLSRTSKGAETEAEKLRESDLYWRVTSRVEHPCDSHADLTFTSNLQRPRTTLHTPNMHALANRTVVLAYWTRRQP
jgi:hypothetical protein